MITIDHTYEEAVDIYYRGLKIMKIDRSVI